MQTLALLDFQHDIASFYDDVIRGLSQEAKTLPCKYFYDAYGSQLFDQICELDEYYPTRTEMAIMRANIEEMTALLGPGCRLVEYGSGSSLKTRVLLDNAPKLASYVPMDISREHLFATAQELAQAYPHLDIRPVCADYTQLFTLPQEKQRPARTVVYFPGSTIGNFHPAQAEIFLRQVAGVCGLGGGLLIGVDLKKSPQTLEPAYNDQKGVTAAFNKNLLTRINRELEGDFDADKFAHHAFYNDLMGRMEMHLVSLEAQSVTIGEQIVQFDEDEYIHTECSYKYATDEFACLASNAGLRVQKVWTDVDNLFSVQYLTVTN